MKKNLFYLLSMLFMALPFQANAQEQAPAAKPVSYRFRLQLTDKKGTTGKLNKPEAYLSKKAIERRQKQGLGIDSTDLPVSATYLKQLRKDGLKVHCVSKWNNTAVVELADSMRGVQLANTYKFVSASRCIWKTPTPKPVPARPQGQRPQGQRPQAQGQQPQGQQPQAQQPQRPAMPRSRQDMVSHDAWETVADYYGPGQNQINLLNGVKLHEAGFKGKGMTIGIIDGGYTNGDVIDQLKDVKIEGTYNFVDPNADIYAASSHGLMVLSCMGTNKPNQMVGTAPEASFWLLASEDSDGEHLAEMDYWAAAIEYADSVGCDVVNTSLGYNDFDNDADDLKYWEMDGHSTLISNSASMCAKKGFILCVSAGNSGAQTWHKLTPPADAEDVLCVGALTPEGINTTFSSLGYSADGRVKPDVTSQGQTCAVISPNGKLSRANGTSFASPILCGMVASLWQALPNYTALELMDLIRKHGHNYAHPDEIYGYGTPDFYQAYLDGKNK